MSFKICQEIKNKEVWESFFEKCGEKTFLQAWNWGEFQERMDNKIWRLGVFDSVQHSVLHNAILAVKITAKRGTFLLIQHLTQISNLKSQNHSLKLKTFEILLEKLKEIAKSEKASFIRIAPLLEKNDENKNLFNKLGFRESPMHASAYEATWKLDVTPSEDQLLANMRKTTRYLIRQAEKNPDIEITQSEKLSEVEVYQKLNREVAQRQKFAPFSDNFIKNEFEVFSGDNQAMWFFGKYKNEIAAGALVIFWSGIGFYHQAASLAKYAKFSIPYLLQWEAIKEAKRRGCKLYDFWGYVDPQKQPDHPWAGPTLFKMGFGGRAYEYMKTQDLPISKKYWLTYIFEKLRSKKRGL